MSYVLLNNILDDAFLETLAKSADLYKIGTNSVLDPEEIRIGLKVVPRAVMAMLISELSHMDINTSKEIKLPFGKMAYMAVSKGAADDYTGSVYDNNKMVYGFQNRSIPGLGIILLSTFELYDMEELSKPHHIVEDADRKVQKLIDERMELHSLVGRVVEDKMSQREAVNKLILMKLNEELAKEKKKNERVSDVTKIAVSPGNANANEYMRGMANGLVVADAIANDKEANFVESPKKPLDVKPADIAKKEPGKKGSPLKAFLERKKKPKEFHVEMTKSETRDCDSCGHTIFGNSGFSGCLCFGLDQNRKIWIKKSEDGVQIRFSKGWSVENMEMLLETLRKR